MYITLITYTYVAHHVVQVHDTNRILLNPNVTSLYTVSLHNVMCMDGNVDNLKDLY